MFSLKTDAALLMVQAEEAQWVMKADGYLRLEVRAGVTDCTVWDLVQEETGGVVHAWVGHWITSLTLP
jgi:hypothetical protein